MGLEVPGNKLTAWGKLTRERLSYIKLKMGRNERVVSIGESLITVTRIEGFSSDIESVYPGLRRKLLLREELLGTGDFLRRHGQKIAFTTGVFDMIHIGHARYLQLARSLGDVLVVGLNSDLSVRKLKGDGRPILGELRRAEMLSFLEQVDYLTIFSETDGSETIRLLKPDAYLCVEGSWEGDIETKAEVIAMAEHGGNIFHTSRQDPTLSTTAIIERIEALAVNDAMRQFSDLVRRQSED